VDVSGNRRFEMGATEETVERLLEDLCKLEDVEIETSTWDGLFWSSYRGPHGPVQTFWFQDKLWFRLADEHGMLSTGPDAMLGGRSASGALRDGEHWMLSMGPHAIREVYFQRGPDVHAPGREGLEVFLYGPQAGHQLAFHFQHLYDEQGEPIAARFARWEELRAKYGGRDKLRVENGRLIPLAEGES
jgi:hypothetical protein